MTSSIHWYPWVSIAEANLSNFEQNETNESKFIATQVPFFVGQIMSNQLIINVCRVKFKHVHDKGWVHIYIYVYIYVYIYIYPSLSFFHVFSLSTLWDSQLSYGQSSCYILFNK